MGGGFPDATAFDVTNQVRPLKRSAMSIDETDKVDFITVDKQTGDVWLTITDHLEWEENDGEHLLLLQEKLNTYLGFIENGEMYERVPATKGRRIVIDVVGKYPLSEQAKNFFERSSVAVSALGMSLQFRLSQPN